MTVPAVILAGGQSRRMGGGDKGLGPLAGRPLIAHVIARLAGDCGPLAINANGDPARFPFGLTVLPDPVAGQPGPLAGILAAMDWAAGTGAAQVLTVPADTPFLPGDLLSRLQGPGGAAFACGPGGAHPAIGLWPAAEAAGLRAALAGGMRRVQDWTAQIGAAAVVFPDEAAFFNVNTPADLARAEAMIGARPLHGL